MSFEIITIDELLKRLDKYNHKELHVHHTWKPVAKQYNGKNGIAIQEGMRYSHVKNNGWNDIGQHVTLLPDGLFVTGRDFSKTPASITGYNTGGFACETLGNFDIPGTGSDNSLGYDVLEGKQKDSLLRLAKYFDDKNRYVRFHRENAAKTCPGTSIDKNVFMNEVRNYGNSTGHITQPQPTQTKSPIQKGKEYVGERCKELQEKLNKVGFNCGNVDGDFGSKTYNALIAFQTKYIPEDIDGLAGNITFSKLDSLIAEINKPKSKPVNQRVLAYQKTINVMGIRDKNGNKLDEDGHCGQLTLSTIDKLSTLKKGVKNVLVGWLQGVIGCEQDNSFGSITESKLKEFQRSHGLEVDGHAGKQTVTYILRNF